jgi:hypothetical protein
MPAVQAQVTSAGVLGAISPTCLLLLQRASHLAAALWRSRAPSVATSTEATAAICLQQSFSSSTWQQQDDCRHAQQGRAWKATQQQHLLQQQQVLLQQQTQQCTRSITASHALLMQHRCFGSSAPSSSDASGASSGSSGAAGGADALQASALIGTVQGTPQLQL